MKRLTTALMIVCMGTAIGCSRKAKPELAAVPPPAEPVEVQDYNAGSYGAQPVQFEPVAPAAPQPVAAPVAQAQGTYTIQKNDSLWKIAERHYGSGQRWVDIANANPGLEPTKMPVGKTIVLP